MSSSVYGPFSINNRIEHGLIGTIFTGPAKTVKKTLLLIDLGNCHTLHKDPALQILLDKQWDMHAFSDYAYSAPVDPRIIHTHCTKPGMNVADSWLIFKLFEAATSEKYHTIVVGSSDKQMLSIAEVVKEKFIFLDYKVVRGWDDLKPHLV